MRSLKKKAAILASVVCNSLFAQQINDVEMADVMHANGKIYVVVAVLCIIFIGIVVYLISIDRKISKTEEALRQAQLDSEKK